MVVFAIFLALQQRVAAASNRVAKLKEELLDVKEELAKLRVVAYGLSNHLFGPS